MPDIGEARMSVGGSCHCGAVRTEVARAPEWVASWNCFQCRRTGWLVAYYRPGEISIVGETDTYVWGDRLIENHCCRVCGCGTHGQPLAEALAGDLPDDLRAVLETRRGVNARLLDGFETGAEPVPAQCRVAWSGGGGEGDGQCGVRGRLTRPKFPAASFPWPWLRDSP